MWMDVAEGKRSGKCMGGRTCGLRCESQVEETRRLRRSLWG
jgi:hypothetical protein